MRTLLLIVVAVATAWWAPASRSEAGETQGASAALEAETLAPGVHLLRGGFDGNVLVVAAGDETLLVDARSPDTAAELIAAVDGLDVPAVSWVVNTHYHEDHRGANGHYAGQGARLVARAAARADMLDDRHVAELGWTLTPAPPEALPHWSLTGPARLHVGDRALALTPLPAGHTDGDLLVELVGADILHVGDQVEVGAYPFVDVWHGGSLAGLVAGADAILQRCDDDTRVVPGHGPTVDRAWLLDYRAMLVGMLERVRAAVAAGTSVSDFMDSAPTAPWDDRFGSAAEGRRFAALSYMAEVGVDPDDG